MEKHIKNKAEELSLLYDCVNLYIDITTSYDYKEEENILGDSYNTRMKKMKELRAKIYSELIKGGVKL